MNDVADTNLRHGSDIHYVVLCTKSDGKKKEFKSYRTDQKQAAIDAAALRRLGIAAVCVEVARQRTPPQSDVSQ